MKDGSESTRMRLLVILLAFSTISITLSGIFGDGGYFQFRSLCHYREKLLEEIVRLEGEIGCMEEDLRELEDEEFRVEKVSREQFGLVKPGEIIIYFDEAEYGAMHGIGKSLSE